MIMAKQIALAAALGGLGAVGTATMALTTERDPQPDASPPRRLSIEPTHEDFHPCYVRVGVRVDGEERTTLVWYDQDRGLYRTLADLHEKGKFREGVIEPYWRYPETRQMRRARERWEAKHR